MDTMWFLMLGHLLGDYAFQSDTTAADKGSNPARLVVHVVTYVVTVAAVYVCGLLLAGREIVALGRLAAVFCAIFALHTIQDLAKARLFSHSRQAYYVDQALHIMQLFAVRLWLG